MWLPDSNRQGPSFNPRAREGRDRRMMNLADMKGEFQSTRPRGARPVVITDKPNWGDVSIHAPARGATSRRLIPNAVRIVSIHAPARGATSDRARPGWLRKFQSTRPRGARLECSRRAICRVLVSIHAPARGATNGNLDGLRLCQVSIHAPTRGATIRRSKLRLLVLFQSTRPRGARLGVPLAALGFTEFQSTRPRGARPNAFDFQFVTFQFQSTRPRGARPRCTTGSGGG